MWTGLLNGLPESYQSPQCSIFYTQLNAPLFCKKAQTYFVKITGATNSLVCRDFPTSLLDDMASKHDWFDWTKMGTSQDYPKLVHIPDSPLGLEDFV